MTVLAEDTRVSYACNGSTTEFSITFKCFSKDDIKVVHVASDGTETVLTETTHYSISGNLATGGKVTTVSTYASGVTILIMLDISLDQETDLPYGGSYTSVSVETMADKLTKICQQLSEKIGREIKFKASSTETDIEIDDLVANKVLIVNSTGDGLEMGATATEISSAQTYAEAASAAQTNAETAQGFSEDAKDLAQAAQVLASASADAAAASAAGVNLPSIEEGDANKILQVLDDETGYELKTLADAGAAADITSMTGLDDGGIPLAKVDGAAASGANADITSMTGLDDGGIPVAKVADAMKDDGSNLAIGADADGDTYHRSGGVLARLAKGAANFKMFMNAAGTVPEWAAGIKIGSFTRDLTAASGDASITGVGFKPSNVIFISGWNNNSFAVGFDNGASAVHGVVASSCFHGTVASIRFLTSANTDATNGKIKSLDSDGFTVTYTLSNSQSGQTGTIYYIAFR